MGSSCFPLSKHNSLSMMACAHLQVQLRSSAELTVMQRLAYVSDLS
jgi:hypothetical protein